MLSAISFLVRINQKCSIFIAKYLPQTKPFIVDIYNKIVADYANATCYQSIIDAGCGTQTSFAKFCNPINKNRIIGIDSSEQALKNNDVNETILVNLNNPLPFGNNSVDIITSSSVLEHLSDVGIYIKNCYRVLKPDGVFINLFSNRHAPFALLNRLLPVKLSRKLLYFFRPSMRTRAGHKAYYNKCTYDQFSQLLRKYNFKIVDFYFSYYQSFYFDFFFPLFIISAIYEIILSALKNKQLCAHMIIVAQKIK